MPDATSAAVDDATPAPSVVTGAAGWLGQNLVRALVPDHREAALLDVLGPNVQTVIGDVRDPDAVDRLFDASPCSTP